ncbi:YWFCY domain-containing protein [Fulvivirga maritima]|uniref:YWFCY domain-containing protein n=1 Tax=Fulvivirga maritima TaxID=2904247 RepID=UPI001F20BA90|nr:YWFCY domain-containing protein [Fulvivirga maritima]UII29076.1 YWFCY domain-containing protein [Fulvivirga maritima]
MMSGDHQQGLVKTMELARIVSLILLLMHLYYYHQEVMHSWGLTSDWMSQLIARLESTGLFEATWISKALSFILLIVSLLGVKGKKDIDFNLPLTLVILTLGGVLYWSSALWFPMNLQAKTHFLLSAAILFTGYLCLLGAGSRLSRFIRVELQKDIFNEMNQTFPQEERFMANAYSLHFPAHYHFRGKRRRSWINVINPFRSLLVIGSPGAGKSYFIIRHIISQHIKKGFTMFIYDFKYDDLSRLAYNLLIRYQKKIQGEALLLPD